MRCQHHQTKACSGTENTDNELGDAARANIHARQFRPRPAEYRCQQNDKQCVYRLEPDRRDFKIADHTVSVVISEQVERGWLLLKRRPEERGGNQQDKADQQSGALFTVQTGKDEQVDKVQGNGGCNHVYQYAGNRDRIYHNHALRNQRNDNS